MACQAALHPYMGVSAGESPPAQEVVSVAIHVDLVSDEFARHWLGAGHLFHITFVSPGTCNDDATSVRTCSLALLGLRA